MVCSLILLVVVPRLIESFREGDLVQLDLLGFHIVVINSARVARDLLDRRSASYSDRPHMVCC
jgi:hypothetical protein